MLQFQDFTIREKLITEKHTVVYRAYKRKNKSPVIIKSLSSEHPDLLDVARLEQEYELLKSLSTVKGLPQVTHLIRDKNQVGFVMEDEGMQTLQHLLSERELNLEEFLHLAIQLTQIVGELTHHRIIHKDIKPANILVDENLDHLTLIDFSAACLLPNDIQSTINTDKLEGTLAYMSPEQTGRMGRSIDYRSDLYSLGITFYEMLTGRLPFQMKDAIGIIHAHIAKTPTSPSEINTNIPSIISDIILKLMAKAAEDRYQSAFGLLHDLKFCLDQLKQAQKIQHFELGKHDVPAKLNISQKLYGREEEIEQLHEAFHKTSQGESVCFLVAGYAGIGKSTLIQESHKSIVASHGYYCEGKLDQLRQIPYVEWSQALSQLISQILTEKEEKIAELKEKLLRTLNGEGQVMIEIVPDLELLIGPQPHLPKTSPLEAQQRFFRVFKKFIKIFATRKHPLVIFLDDLQWSGVTSLQLITTLLCDPDIHYLMLIGAYRNNEVKEDHPLKSAINKIQSAITFYSANLQPLTEFLVTELLVDTLYSDHEKIKDLSELCFQKTRGNPFFLDQFLQALYEENLIRFNSKLGRWEWDLEKIQNKQSTDNVIELMTTRLHQLPEETQHLLQLASCIGYTFDSKTLSLIDQSKDKDTINNLWSALQEGYILPIDGSYKYVKQISNIDVTFKFLHDKVQQAAYELIPDSIKKQIHLNIANILLDNTENIEESKVLFDVVNHFDRALDLITEPEKIKKIAQLNLIASKKAKETTFFQLSYRYSSVGLKLLSQQMWKEDYPFMLDLYNESTESAYLTGHEKKMKECFEIVIKKARTLLDKIKVYEIMIGFYALTGKLDESIDMCLFVLRGLGISAPKHPKPFHIMPSVMKLKACLLKKNIPDLIDLPEMTDPEKLAMVSIASRLHLSAFFSRPFLPPLIGLKMAILSIKYGNSIHSALSYCSCAVVFTVLNDIPSAIKFANLALALCDKFHAKNERALVLLFLSGVLYPRIYNIKNTVIPNLWESYQLGCESTYREFAWYALNAYFVYSYQTGQELNQLDSNMEKYYKIASKENFTITKLTLSAVISLIKLLKSGPYCDLKDKYWFVKANKVIEYFTEINDKVAVTSFSITQEALYVLFGFYSLASECSARVDVTAIKPLFIRSSFHFYDCLLRVALYENAKQYEKRSLIKKIKAHIKILNKWAVIGPENYQHKYYLAQAEYHRILGKEMEAAKYYNLAIPVAEKNGYIHELALSNELAGKFYISLGMDKVAKGYLTDAHYNYLKWGATGKANQLTNNYKELFNLDTSHKKDDNLSLTSSITRITRAQVSQALDFETLLKATQAISSEVVLSKLVETILQVVLENMGADKCILLLKKNQQLFIEGQFTENGKENVILQSIPISNWDKLPNSIIDYVQRTQKYIVLNNVMTIEPYNKDPYVIQHKPKSILCFPIMQQQTILGILYFENKLTTNAFTPERLEILTPLSVQIAISIENARLYQAFERFVPKEFLTLLEKRSLVDVQLGDAVQKILTILFMDIKGFTTLSERQTPKEVFQFINTYLSHMEPIISEHRGFIDKYLGDGIMALFPNTADDAVAAAIQLQEAIINYNKSEAVKPVQNISARLGINTGPVMLGTVGTSHRIDGSAMSDAVNTAARIMELNRLYGSSILIGDLTYMALNSPGLYQLRRLDKIKLRGKSEVTSIWEVFSSVSSAYNPISELIPVFEAALEQYQKGQIEVSKDLFIKCLKIMPNDKASQIFLNRCNHLLIKGIPDNWDGTTEFEK